MWKRNDLDRETRVARVKRECRVNNQTHSDIINSTERSCYYEQTIDLTFLVPIGGTV